MVQLVDFASGAPKAGTIDVRWIHGSPSAKHNTDPDIQVHAYDAHTVILRQNKAVDYEAPFLFLLFGNERAVLLDTGATASAAYFPLRRVVDELIERWLAAHPRDGYELLVLHTHGHGDHVAGDGQFADRPDTTVVDADLERAWAYFGFDADPERVAHVDLGGRVLECLATPGHHAAAVTFYDPWTGFLLTGDTVYPGRLYVEDWAAFRDSIDRLIAFARQRPGHPRPRLPHRDDPPTGRRLSGPHHLPAGRAAAADDRRAAPAGRRRARHDRRRDGPASAPGLHHLHVTVWLTGGPDGRVPGSRHEGAGTLPTGTPRAARGTRKVTPTLDVETELWGRGHLTVAGMDEVGRGAWAGPLTVGIAVLAHGCPPVPDAARRLEVPVRFSCCFVQVIVLLYWSLYWFDYLCR